MNALTWSYAEPQRTGLQLVRKVEATMRMQRFLSLDRRGVSLLEFRFDVNGRPDWAGLRLEGRAMRVHGEQRTSVTVRLDDAVVYTGRVHRAVWLPGLTLGPGEHSLTIALDPDAESTTLIGSVTVAFGSGAAPAAGTGSAGRAIPRGRRSEGR